MAKTRVIGLDIGTTQVRAAELEFAGGGPSRTSQPTVVKFGEVPLPLGAVRDGEVTELQTVATAIKQLWARVKFSHKDVVIGIGNQRVVVRDLDLPWMPLAQLRSSLPFQAQEMLPVAVEDAVLDYVPTGSYVGEHGNMVRGLLVAATKDTVQANVAAVEAAGLKPVMVDLGAFALARVMARGDLLGRTLALVDIGARVTTVVVVANGVPSFVRMLPSGGQDVSDAVGSAMGASAADAELIKRQLGIGFSAAPELAPAAEAIRTITTSLVEAIRNTFVYYTSNNPGAPTEMVLLTGGGSQLPGLGQYLSSASRLPVTLGQPLSTLRLGSGAGSPEHLNEAQHALAMPLGLAFGAAA
ncbi:type IV pilus assembly protein PilM [Cellulomonas fimi]|uniref:Type IV pilus assembly protein PilM n=1 Tax=Cellulomonas fimi TaxID=1708 RepID=A0A7Y0LYF2_CELFI|nr:type IV pilus assembly protein PilM [Cellulomonas fimi]NMR20164.1 type IV pilus assembly protein PilM [Cellulomonas fimi]